MNNQDDLNVTLIRFLKSYEKFFNYSDESKEAKIKTLNDFISELEATEGYFFFPPHIEPDGTRVKGPVKVEQLKSSLKLKAAHVIREMFKTIDYYSRMDGLASEQHALACLNKIDGILNEVKNENS